ncbi:hypothetical protein FJZ21_02710 [Candidatus Pacearchaeota archaeon]|nr:hypothetical protein [Candidatus Pacearchaeota archaeon]
MMMTSMFMPFFSLHDLYSQWETSGVFDFLLPALLIFAVIFGILTSTGVLGANRGVNFVIAATSALMAMRLQIVSDFFGLLLPGLGIGVAVLVTVLILSGLFLQKANWRQWMPTFFWGGVVIGLIIVISVLNSFAWFGSVWWQVNWVSVVWIVVIVAILAPLFVTPKTENEKEWENQNFEIPFVNLRGKKEE